MFEYSATFGQILSERNKETLEEYSKSIVFDYSYKYFYLDGYGKDFFVINAKILMKYLKAIFLKLCLLQICCLFTSKLCFIRKIKD